MTVWLVTAGEYSDFHIEGVFSSETLAKAYQREWQMAHAGDRANVESWDVDALASQVARPHSRVILLDDGTEVESCERWQTLLVPATGYRGRGMTQHGWWTTHWVRGHVGISPLGIAHARALAIEARQAWLRRETGEGNGER